MHTDKALFRYKGSFEGIYGSFECIIMFVSIHGALCFFLTELFSHARALLRVNMALMHVYRALLSVYAAFGYPWSSMFFPHRALLRYTGSFEGLQGSFECMCSLLVYTELF